MRELAALLVPDTRLVVMQRGYAVSALTASPKCQLPLVPATATH